MGYDRKSNKLRVNSSSDGDGIAFVLDFSSVNNEGQQMRETGSNAMKGMYSGLQYLSTVSDGWNEVCTCTVM